MKNKLIKYAVLGAMIGSSAVQAGFDRSGQSTAIILADGNVVEIVSAKIAPKVTGAYTESAALLGIASGDTTGDVTPSFSSTSMGLRLGITDSIAIALIHDSPFGADLEWAKTGKLYTGVKAQMKSNATTALLSKSMGGATVYGGLKNQSLSVTASVPFVSSYTIDTGSDTSLGYVVGGAFQKPEIALKVALTYHTKIKHDYTVTETSAAMGTNTSALSVSTPSSINLDFQTGIMANTLVFGSIRKANWSETEATPGNYKTLTAAAGGKSLLEKGTDTTTYSVGLGRKLNETWSVAATYGYEKGLSATTGPLTVTDGFNSYGFGATYTADKVSVTLGVKKINFGDQKVKTITAAGTSAATMSSNSSLVTALKVAYKF